MTGRFALLALLAFGLGPGAPPARAEVPVIRVIPSDRDMGRAFAAAREMLPTALAATEKRHGRFSPSLALRVAVPVMGDGVRVELVWVDTIHRTADGFVGRIASHPRIMESRLRDRIAFRYAQVADWAVQAEDGRFYGYYTTRVMLDRLPPETAAEVRAILVPRPIPPLWRQIRSEPRPPDAEPEEEDLDDIPIKAIRFN